MSDEPKYNSEEAHDEVSEEYAYLDRGGFSSEKFKIELRGLPKFYGIAELKKLMNQKLSLNASKIKRPKNGSHWLYACFPNDEERAKAVAALNGYSWKGKTLIAEDAKPAPDPLVRKRRQDEEGTGKNKKAKKDENKSQEERLKDATTPYWRMAYDEQLKLKEAEIRNLLKKLDSEMWKASKESRADIEAKRKLFDGLSFELLPIERSPVTEGYRNKCEFTVGVDEESKLPTVGFRLGSYVTGTVGVAPVAAVTHVSESTKQAVLLFQEFVRASQLAPFSPADYSGHWRYLTVRHSKNTGHLMLIVAFHPQSLSAEELDKIKSDLVEHFSSEEAVKCGVKSLYFELALKRNKGEDAAKPEHLSGDTHIIDSILDRNFRISPEAFFQINTAGADILYKKAIEMSRTDESSTVIDICCGTGTIGLCFANDMNSDDQGRLSRDVTQNCDEFTVDPASRTISFERFFDTCDDDDYVIEDGTTHVVWARGADKLFSSKGLCLPCASPEDRGFIRVRLLTVPALPKPKAKEVRFTNRRLKVPGGDTTYWCHVQRLPDFLVQRTHYIVQFESSITRGNEGLVHHMEVFYCDAGPDAEIPLYEGNCFAPDRPEVTQTCSKVKAAWAMGAPPFTYPEETGLPIGGPKSNKYVMLEVHYNNPQMKNDWVDSSGIVLHVTSQRRRFDAAIIELGLQYIDKMAIPGRQLAFPLTAHCIPQCTGVGLPADGIVVFGSQLHTHLTGVAVWTRHSRRGVELPMLNRDTHYSTHFQEIRRLHRPVKVLPGDYLETSCMYRTLDKANATIGGHAITDEMCVNYIYYYPATELEVCKSAVADAQLEKYFQFEQRWDNMSVSLEASPRQNYLSIGPWTPLRAQALHKLYSESPISMQCNKSDGNRFQGDWEGLPVPKIKVPLPPEPRRCPDTRKTFKTL